MTTQPSHDPQRLHAASLERVAAARRALQSHDAVMCIYLGGLAVECILQGIVHLDTPQHDARHDLTKWLGRCRTSLREAIRSSDLRASWSHVCSLWRNDWRYYSSSALYGVFRKMGRTRGIKGDQGSVLQEVARRFHDSVVLVHNKGLVAWANYTKK